MSSQAGGLGTILTSKEEYGGVHWLIIYLTPNDVYNKVDARVVTFYGESNFTINGTPNMLEPNQQFDFTTIRSIYNPVLNKSFSYDYDWNFKRIG